MAYNVILNKDKSIGKVVFIVEGDKKEHTLLSHIFTSIFDYSVVDVKRNKTPVSKYVSKTNIDSRIFVVSSETSNIKSAGESGNDYLDRVYSSLFDEYSLEISNASVYYIFDRDNESNMFSETESLTKILKNSRDNGIETNGLLLLSYPCIESYIKSCMDNFYGEFIDSPRTLKLKTSESRYQYNKIDSDEIVNSCINMLMGIKVFCKRELCDKDLDDFYDVNHIDLGLLSFEYTESEND